MTTIDLNEPDPAEPDALDALVEEFTERLRRGDSVTMEDYLREYPQFAEGIREFFPTIAALEKLRSGQNDTKPEPPRESLPEQLGDFRIVREIGRGGMGIVYEAIQVSLDRRVALKVLSPARLNDQKSLKRFEREARTAAQLHHTNIVSVLGVGHEQNQHYFVMQYIEGVSLDQVICQLRDTDPQDFPTVSSHLLKQASSHSRPTKTAEGNQDPPPTWAGSTYIPGDNVPHTNARQGQSLESTRLLSAKKGNSYWLALASLGHQVASALEYAHSQGVLHRDIKPANLILDPHGQLWVADFGLAKAVEYETVSRTGDIVGTLRYMAPEQLRGTATPQSDIYSLGVTLYELLTLEPGHSNTIAKRRLEGHISPELLPPRKVNPGIPRDLETILMKATATDLKDRYQDAGELATDLSRFLEDRPLATKRASWWERSRRWCRRNPGMAALSGLAGMLLGLLVVVAAIGYASTKAALEEQSTQRARAEKTLEISLDALERVYLRLAPENVGELTTLTASENEDIPLQPVLSPETAALLEELLPVYDQLAEQEGGGQKLARDIAKANRRVGDIYWRLRNSSAALSAYEAAVSRYQALSQISGELNDQIELARVHNALGNVHRQLQDRVKSTQAHFTALKSLNELLKHSPDNPELRYEVARTYYYLGRGPDDQTVPPPPNRPPRDGRDFRGPLRRDSPGPRFGESGPGNPLLDRRSLQYAVSILEELTAEFPKRPHYFFLLAVCLRDLTPPEMRGEDDEAINILSRLVKEHPNVADYRYELAETYVTLDERSQRREDAATSENRVREALRHAEQLHNQSPHQPNYAMLLVHIKHRLVMLLRRPPRDGERPAPDRGREIEELTRSALQMQQDLVKRFPNVTGYRIWLAKVQETRAEELHRRGEHSEAKFLLEAATLDLIDSLKSYGQERHLGQQIGRLYELLADVHQALGEESESLAARKIAAQFGSFDRPHPRAPMPPRRRD